MITGQPSTRSLLRIGVVLTMLLPSIAKGDSLHEEMAVVAKSVSEFLKSQNADAIAIGQFSGPATLPTSSGPAIAKVLEEELGKVSVHVKRVAQYGIKGDYSDVNDEKSGKLAARIRGEVTDRSDKVLFTFERAVFGVPNLAALFGVTVDLPPQLPDTEREAEFIDSLDHPQATTKNSRISASPTSPYAIEILVTKGDNIEARTPVVEDGLAFVDLRRDETYAIKLINQSDHDAAVTLTIDGLSVFTFSENQNYNYFIINAHEEGLIPGWHRTNDVSDSFVITAYAKSAAAEKLVSGDSIGTVTATFAAAWERGEEPPADELIPKGARSGDATGRGPEVKREYKEVLRDVGQVRASISVRYEK